MFDTLASVKIEQIYFKGTHTRANNNKNNHKSAKYVCCTFYNNHNTTWRIELTEMSFSCTNSVSMCGRIVCMICLNATSGMVPSPFLSIAWNAWVVCSYWSSCEVVVVVGRKSVKKWRTALKSWMTNMEMKTYFDLCSNFEIFLYQWDLTGRTLRLNIINKPFFFVWRL